MSKGVKQQKLKIYFLANEVIFHQIFFMLTKPNRERKNKHATSLQPGKKFK